VTPRARDLRLLPSALAVWLASMALTATGVAVSVAVAVAALTVAAVLWRRPSVVLVCLLTAAAGLAVGLRLAARDRGPLDELAAAGRSVTVEATVAEEPRRSSERTWGSQPVTQVVGRVRVSAVLVDGSVTRVRQPLLVVGQGDGWDPVELGDRLQLRLSLHPAESADQVAAVGWVQGQPRIVARPPPLLAGAEVMRSGLRDAAQRLQPDPRGLLPALVVGDTSRLPADLVADLRASGLSHLTAVSGDTVH
jgi:competence protein ComEC